MKVFGFVYLILNLANGKVYIGQTKGPIKYRWRAHLKQVGTNKMYSLHRAIQKHGPENFRIVELHRAFSEQELDEAEKWSIFSHDSRNPEFGYNIAEGGGVTRNFGASNGLFGIKISGEEKKRRGALISIANTGKKRSKDTKDKMSVSLLGNKRAANKPKTEEHKKKISESRKKWWDLQKAS